MFNRCVLTVGAMVLAAPASLAQPFILVADASGNKVVRYRFSNGLPFDHFTGEGLSPLETPLYMAEAPDGQIVVASRSSDSVECFDPETGEWVQTLIAAGLGGLDGPRAVCFDEEGFIYVSSSFSNEVIKYTPAGAFDKVLVSSGLDEPSGLAVGPNGFLYVVNRNLNQVRFYNRDTGVLLGSVVTTGLTLVTPNHIVFDAEGNLYISGRNSNNILRVDTLGVASTLVPSGPGLLRGPGQMIINDDGDLVVACADSNAVLEYDLPTGELLRNVVTAADLGGLESVSGGIAFGPEASTGETGCNPADLDADGDVDLDDIEFFIEFFNDGC